jgi:hypothetical protein
MTSTTSSPDLSRLRREAIALPLERTESEPNRTAGQSVRPSVAALGEKMWRSSASLHPLMSYVGAMGRGCLPYHPCFRRARMDDSLCRGVTTSQTGDASKGPAATSCSDAKSMLSSRRHKW